MSFDERDLRKALDARSGEVTPEFRARLNKSLAETSPQTGWMPAIAVATAIALTVISVSVLVAARHFMGTRGSAASGARVVSPSPTVEPGNVQLSAPSTNTVWALVHYDRLYLSTDQGSHWEQRPMPPQFGVRPSISFINDHEGWLLAPGSPVTKCGAQLADIWHTTDGGATWQDLGARVDKTQCKESIWFVDPNRGFVTAWDPNHQPNVYRTSDAGDHWAPSTLPDPPDFKTLPGGYSLRVEWIKAFGSTLYLEAYGSQGAGTPYPEIRDRQYIFTSTDGGATWAWKQKVGSRAMAMLTEYRWLLLTSPGHLDETTNGGQQSHPYFSDIASDTPVDGSAMVFADATVGYVSSEGKLQSTTKGGLHWTLISTPGMQAVQPTATPTHDIVLPTSAQLSASGNTVWALVQAEYLARSTDRGSTWEQRTWVPYDGGGGQPVISFVDDMHGWALFPGVPATRCSQAAAQLWRTSDGAATWQLVASVTATTQDPNGLPFDQCKEYVAFIDSTRGFVAGHDFARRPIISRTADGGVTWARSTLPDPPGFVTDGGSYLRVFVISSFDGVLLAAATNDVGKAYAFRSTDGGATWAYVAATTGLGIAFVTATRWIQVILPDQSAETTDSGASWHRYASDYSQAAPVAPQIVFADALVGYATARGSIQRTLDGGRHWSPIQTPGVMQTG